MVLGWLLACDPEAVEERRQSQPGDTGDSAELGPSIDWITPSDGSVVTAPLAVEVQATVASAPPHDPVASISLYIDDELFRTEEGARLEGTFPSCADEPPHELRLAAVATSEAGATWSSEITVTRAYNMRVTLDTSDGDHEQPDRELRAFASSGEELVMAEWRLDGVLVASSTPRRRLQTSCDDCSGECWVVDATLDLRPYLSVVDAECTVLGASGVSASAASTLYIQRDHDGDGRDSIDWGENDCDDDDREVYGGAHEYCDRKDNDCDFSVDEDCSDEPTWPGTWTSTDDAATTVSTWAEAEMGMPTLAADFTGDGVTDLVMGAPYYDGYPHWWGGVYFAPGPFSGEVVLDENNAAIVHGDDEGSGIGEALAAGDDYDGDGCEDAFLTYGCDGGCWFSGASVTSGVTTDVGHTVVYGADDGAPTFPSAVGDLTGDGNDDLAVVTHDGAAAADAGHIFLITGPFVGDVATADAAVVVEGTSDLRVGMHAWAGDEDLDGDGVNDLVVPASSSAVAIDDFDAVVVFQGPLAGGTAADAASILLLDAEPSERARPWLVGDVDGDGTADLALGIPYADDAAPGAGKVLLHLGPVASGSHAGFGDLALLGETSADLAGWSVEGLASGGAPGMLLVGVPRANSIYDDAGAVYRVAMPASGTLDLEDVPDRWVAGLSDGGVGSWILTGQDLDADGVSDVTIAAPGILGAALIFPKP